MSELMKISNLENYGICLLTGEADKLMIRTLCDVSETGRRIIQEFLSVPELKLYENWNSKVGKYEAIGSILLTYNTIRDLMKFIACKEKNCYAYLDLDNELLLLDKSSEWFKKDEDSGKMRIEEDYMMDMYKKLRFNPIYNFNNSDRNEHQFSGRTY